MLREFVTESFIACTSAIVVCWILPVEGVLTGAAAGVSGYVFPEIYRKIKGE